MERRFVYLDFPIPIEAYGGVAGFANVEVEVETKRVQEGIYEWEITGVRISPVEGGSSREPSGEDYDALVRRIDHDFHDVIDMQISWNWEDMDG